MWSSSVIPVNQLTAMLNTDSELPQQYPFLIHWPVPQVVESQTSRHLTNLETWISGGKMFASVSTQICQLHQEPAQIQKSFTGYFNNFLTSKSEFSKWGHYEEIFIIVIEETFITVIAIAIINGFWLVMQIYYLYLQLSEFYFTFSNNNLCARILKDVAFHVQQVKVLNKCIDFKMIFLLDRSKHHVYEEKLIQVTTTLIAWPQ